MERLRIVEPMPGQNDAPNLLERISEALSELDLMSDGNWDMVPPWAPGPDGRKAVATEVINGILEDLRILAEINGLKTNTFFEALDLAGLKN